jgi:2'-5' RNA ligase
MKRLFFGLEPESTTCLQCANIIQAIDNSNCQPVIVANLHVTLVFLGAVNPGTEAELINRVKAITGAKITISFDQLSYWKQPRTLCLTIARANLTLLALVEQLSTLAQQLKIPLDARPYQPHVTLARKVRQPVRLTFEPIIWQADAFCLYESCSTGHGVAYRVIERWLLRL